MYLEFLIRSQSQKKITIAQLFNRLVCLLPTRLPVCYFALLKFWGSWTLPNCWLLWSVPYMPADSLRECIRCISQPHLLLENTLIILTHGIVWALSITFLLYQTLKWLARPNLPKTPFFGLKIAHLHLNSMNREKAAIDHEKSPSIFCWRFILLVFLYSRKENAATNDKYCIVTKHDLFFMCKCLELKL